MRLAPLILLAACDSRWEIDYADCFDCVTERPYFYDADGDGWGELGSIGQMLPQADTTTWFTAVNDLDCDDADPDVRGLTGSICPERLVTGGADYIGVIYDYESELVVVHADTPLVVAAAAEDACGPWGWGGGLALIEDTTELAQLQAAVGDEPAWAGWVGLVGDGAGGWVWEDGATFGPPFRLCDEQGEGERLALVKQGEDWCFGAPRGGKAHLVCERETPDPEEYAVDDVSHD